MTHATKTWLVFSAIGFIFGVMCSSMGFALKKLESNNQK